MLEFLSKLFNTKDFPARWTCGQWTSGHGWLHILSDLGVWSAYLAIPCVLIYFLLRRRDLPFRKIFLLFGAFILLCGTTHLMEAVIFWWPAYRLAGILKLVTALVSWATVFALVRVVPTVLSLRSPEELEREITARTQAEDALKHANAKLELRVEQRTAELSKVNAQINVERDQFRTTLASIGDAVMAINNECCVTFLNLVAHKLTGWTLEEAQGKPLGDVMKIINELTRLPVENPAIPALTQGIVVELANHTLLIAKDGTETPIEDSAAPIRDAAGKLVGAVLVFRDVTERRRSENALKESEQRFRLMADSIPQMAWTARPTGEIYWYNRRWYDYTGTTLEEMQRDGWQSMHDPAMLPKVMDRWNNSLTTGQPFEMVFPLRGKDGLFRHFLTRVEPVNNADGRLSLWVGTNTDVSNAKQAEDRLREGRERLDFALDAAELGHFEFNLADGQIRRTLKHDQIFGYDSLVENWDNQRFLAHVVPADREIVTKLFNEAVAVGKPWNVEYRIRRADGAERWIWTKARVQQDEQGNFQRVLGVMGDNTERKQMEGELRRLAMNLAEADRRKDEFLATLAHELRNPLAPIRNGLQVLRMTGHGTDTVDQIREMMDRQLSQMVRLVDDLMDVSRITRNKLELRISQVELAQVFALAIETSRPLIDAAGHELTVTLPPTPIIVNADETRLSQVFSNLLNNSAKYTRGHGHIQFSASRMGDEVCISVKDDGIGIRTDMLSKVFDMFTQDVLAVDRSQGGLGIGLMLVKRLVEMHGGTAEARSDGPGTGSEFVIRLPIADETSDRREIVPQAGLEKMTPSKRRILVVDDNQDSATSLQMLLSLMGDEIRTANDGFQAVAAAEAFKPDVILLDIGLPKLNGYEVCRQIRQQPWSKNTVIIACTGWGQQDDIRKSKDAGFDQHMVKPVDTGALMQLLAALPKKE